MLNGETKRKIQSLRDTLVGKLPSPTDQVKQITLGLIYKFMSDIDKENVDLLGGKSFFNGEYEKYSWENILDPAISSYERVIRYSEGLDKMNLNPNIPELFRNIFKGAYLPYKDPAILSQFLKEIDMGFKYEHSEDLGDAFEFLLSIMSTQGAAGQFRTPRHIINFIVKVVQPNKNDRILDPACGTAGFLISAYKYILENNKADDSNKPGSGLTLAEKNKLTENFVGYDISPDMVSLSLVNMYLHKFANPNIKEYDTLTNDDLWDEDFDCIMANPPFMTPKGGIRPHKRFAIQANRSELLFVDYIAEHLLANGKAGVIVPEGIIFQSTNAYKALRKMLVDDNYLYAVVSLPAGIFQPYAGVKTSILFMDKALASKADNILFVKIENDGFDLGAQRRDIDKNDLPLALEVILRYKKCLLNNEELQFKESEKNITNIAKKEKIRESGDYNLTQQRYEVIIKKNSIYPLVELKDCLIEKDLRNREDKNLKYKVWSVSNTLGFINSSDYFNKKVASDNVENYKIVLPNFFAYNPSRINVGSIALNNTENIGIVSPMYVVFDINKKSLNRDYLFKLLKSAIGIELINKFSIGSVRKTLRFTDLVKIKIPLPPLEIQQEIVEELNEYQKIIDGARQVVENYKPRIKIDPSWQYDELNNIAEIISGQSPAGKYYNKDKIGLPFYQGKTNFGDIYLKEPTEWTKEYTKIAEKNDILITVRAPVGPVNLNPFKICIGRGLAAIRAHPNFNYLFVFYYLKSIEKEIQSNGKGSTFDSINRDQIGKIRIPIPDIELQNKIVKKINEEQILIESNKKLIEIYEQKIKEKINKIWEK